VIDEDVPAEDLKNSKPRSSPRTDYYLFGSSQDGLDVNPEVVRRREDLHRKFVKKLGHPDSLVSLRRLVSDQDAIVAGEDGGDDDAEEEEAPPPPPKGRKTAKGGKANKLTPMEIQFLDIKRKHMDTVLIMEVGYKFRFLGEDARIAAKELSIVCIPGKFRYDERMYIYYLVICTLI